MNDLIDVVVCKLNVGCVEDPDIFVAEPIINWQNSESGKFIMEKSIGKPSWHRSFAVESYGYEYSIRATLRAVDYTYWKLKYE